MTHPFTVAHISDLHLSPVYRRENIRNTKRVLESVLRLRVDHVVLTGDITADADPRDFALARSLLSGLGLLHSRKLTVVPGNHDIFGGVHTPEDIFTFPSRCRDTNYREKQKEFARSFSETFDTAFFPDAYALFPFVKLVGPFLIVGMNSVPPYSALRNPIGSNGAVDEDQRRRVEHMLRSHPFRRRPTLILIHHHFTKGEQKTTGRMGNIWGVVEGQTMKLRGKRELLKTFREVGADLVLHGHFHENRMYRRKGVLFLNGGGTVLKREAGELPVNIIRYVRGGISVETIGVAAVDPLVCTSPPMRTHAWDSAPREAGRGGRERDFGRVPFRRPALNPKE